MEECCVCFDHIDVNIEYALINNDIEKGIYHTQCLENWIKTSNNGILTQDKITSYLIFNGDMSREIELNNITKDTVYFEPSAPNIEQIDENFLPPPPYSEIDPSHNREINQNRPSCNKGLLLCGMFLAIMLIFVLVALYRYYV